MPIFFVLAGPNGAGKTTITSSLKSADPGLIIINGDLVYQNQISSGLNIDAARQETKRIVTELFYDNLRSGKDFLMESNMQYSHSYEMFLYAANHKFTSVLYYVGVENPDICFQRVQARYNAGIGHFVEKKDVEKRYKASLFNLKTNLAKPDQILFFDNTNFNLEPVIYLEKGLITEISTDCPDWIRENFRNQFRIQEQLQKKIITKNKLNRGFSM